MYEAMGSQLLSSVVQQQLHSLCLSNFPCGHGSWRKSETSKSDEQSWGYMERDEVGGGADKEGREALVDLLTCPLSPWRHEGSWSPQARALRELSAQTPTLLHDDFIFNHFTTLRIVDKDVSVIDDGILKFSNLKELILSVNRISELCAAQLPCSLRVLELYANKVSNLEGLTCHQLPNLQHLGLGSNRLGSQADIQYLKGIHWPQLVSLDLSWCDYQRQQALVGALATLPCLRTLALEGNPLTLAPSYPGFTLDSLPRLFYLDSSRVTPEDRYRFRGLAKMTELIVDQTAVAVAVHKVQGIPDPQQAVDVSAPDFPVISYSYSVTYEFLNQQPSVNKEDNCDSTSTFDKLSAIAHVDGSSDMQQTQNKTWEHEMSQSASTKPDLTGLVMDTDGNSYDVPVLRHSTSKLPWTECMDFTHTQSYVVDDLGALKRFLSRGLWLTLEEEKTLSWPAPSAEAPVSKPLQNPKEKKGEKGKEAPSKAGLKDKAKDKKKKTVTGLVHDAPVSRVLGSVHVPLHTLVTGKTKVDILCDLGVLHTRPSSGVTLSGEKDSAKKVKDEKKREDRKQKPGSDSALGQKIVPPSKGKGKGGKENDSGACVDDPVSVQLDPVTVEFSVQLEKWQSTSEAHKLLPQ